MRVPAKRNPQRGDRRRRPDFHGAETIISGTSPSGRKWSTPTLTEVTDPVERRHYLDVTHTPPPHDRERTS
jgi:hypothetical protein